MTARKTTCDECPFTKTSLAGWLANYTPIELHRIVMSELAFPCHMTHEKDLTWKEAEDNLLCAGAIRYMRKNAKQPRREDLAELVNGLTVSDLDNILSMKEFFEHHER